MKKLIIYIAFILLGAFACTSEEEINPILETELTVQMDSTVTACCGDDPPPCPSCK
ncbi:MAG: hypothetical protein AAGI07_05085 [Bacteroidota bacterium]